MSTRATTNSRSLAAPAHATPAAGGNPDPPLLGAHHAKIQGRGGQPDQGGGHHPHGAEIGSFGAKRQGRGPEERHGQDEPFGPARRAEVAGGFLARVGPVHMPGRGPVHPAQTYGTETDDGGEHVQNNQGVVEHRTMMLDRPGRWGLG
jgi:hypothetical protein